MQILQQFCVYLYSKSNIYNYGKKNINNAF